MITVTLKTFTIVLLAVVSVACQSVKCGPGTYAVDADGRAEFIDQDGRGRFIDQDGRVIRNVSCGVAAPATVCGMGTVRVENQNTYFINPDGRGWFIDQDGRGRFVDQDDTIVAQRACVLGELHENLEEP